MASASDIEDLSTRLARTELERLYEQRDIQFGDLDMHELRKGEADGKEVDLSKIDPVLIAQIRSYADQAIDQATNSSERHAPLRRKGNGRFSKKQVAQMQKQLSQTNNGGVQKPGKGPTEYTNANGETVKRSKAIKTWCHRQTPKRCLGCYQPGHWVAECTNAVARGAPQGYVASAQA